MELSIGLCFGIDDIFQGVSWIKDTPFFLYRRRMETEDLLGFISTRVEQSQYIRKTNFFYFSISHTVHKECPS